MRAHEKPQPICGEFCVGMTLEGCSRLRREGQAVMPPRPSVTGRELHGAGRVTLAEALASAAHPGGRCQLRAVLCSDCVF